MTGFLDRMIGAAKLNAGIFEEIEHDEDALGQALGVVVISSAAAGIGGVLAGGIFGLIGGALAALVGWFVWAFLAHFIGTTMLAEPQTKSSVQEMMRVTGFASAPGVIRIFGFLPLIGGMVNLIAGIWMLAAFVVAVRQALDYQSTGRAILVCVIGFVAQFIIFSLLALLGLGGLLFW